MLKGLSLKKTKNRLPKAEMTFWTFVDHDYQNH